MRPRYILVWGDGAEDQVRRCDIAIRSILPRRETFQRAHLFSDLDTPITPAPTIGGWIIGRMFRGSDPVPLAELPSHEQLAVASTRGGHLLSIGWGAYVALWQDPGGIINFFRDPSGMLPCLYYLGGGWACCTSDPDLLRDTGLVDMAPDWDMLGHHLLFPQLPTRKTCLAGIVSVLPGETVRQDGAVVTQRQVWVPGHFHTPVATSTAAIETVRHLAEVIERCVGVWARCLEPTMLELSGGLDSSIIASSMARSGAHWRALTVATHAADGDERRYARMAAAALAVDLEERGLDHHGVDPLAEPTRLLATPGGMTIQRGFDQIVTNEAEQHGVTGLLSGTGGDNVFCLLASSAPLLDAWQAGGGPLARMALRDIARQTGATQFDVARRGLARWLTGLYRQRRWRADRMFLAPGISRTPHAHPWLDLPRRAPQGLWGHIAMILRAHRVLDAHDRASRCSMVFPLLSQPVLEACLAIPSWQWIEGGRDRSVARDGFAGRLPAALLARRRKGHLSTTFAQAYERDRLALREFLCDGALAAAGLVDRSALAEFLARPVIHDIPDWFRVLELADAELWVRHAQKGRGQSRSGSES